MKLSLLVCTLQERALSLDRLKKVLLPQLTSEVEVLYCCDNKTIPTGKKRNILLERAKGDYIAFIDDDDLVSPTYVKDVLEAIKYSPDCCSLVGEIELSEKHSNGYRRIKRLFKHSIDYKSWYLENNVYYRSPNHLNAIKKDIACSVGFPNITIGEDRVYSEALLPLLKTEVKIKNVLYYYYAS
jgi:glycosyltransferase involved in cell wall biosynthesis